jgi:hypothetical protein
MVTDKAVRTGKDRGRDHPITVHHLRREEEIEIEVEAATEGEETVEILGSEE